jgi:hypothetical protein
MFPLNEEACFLVNYCQEIFIDNGPLEMGAIRETKAFEIPDSDPTKFSNINRSTLNIRLFPNPANSMVQLKSENGSNLNTVE